MEYGMLISPAFRCVGVGIAVDSVQRMNVSVRLVGEGVRRLLIVRSFQMSRYDVVVTAVRITGGLVVYLTAICVGRGPVYVFALHLDGDDFAVRHVERVGQSEVIALRRGDTAADLPEQIVILAVIVRGLGAPGTLPGGILRLRSVFFHAGDLCRGVDIHVVGLALLRVLFTVAVYDELCFEIRAGMTVRGRCTVRIVILVIISTL